MNTNTKIAILAVIVLAGLSFFYWKNNMIKEMKMQGKPTPTPLFVQGSEPAQDEAMKPAGENISIPIKNFTFTPTELRIKVGQTVTWTNEDSTPHNIVANDNSFKSDTLQKGQSFSFTFSKAGTFDYVCTFHAPMKAKIIVE